MPLISFSKLSKYFGARDILKECDWSIEAGRRIGLIGPNGAGKTTMFKLMLGTEEPSSGAISKQKGLSIGHLSQTPHFDPGHTLHQEMLTAKPELMKIEEEMKQSEHDMGDPEVAADADRMQKVMDRYSDLQGQFAALDGYAYESRVESVLEGMRFEKADFDREVSTFSGGEQTRLMLAKLLVAEPDLLLLDEPTNHLDTMMCEWLEVFIKDFHGSMICISHDRYFLDKVATEIVELKDAAIEIYPGNYSKFKELKQEAFERQAKEYDQQKAHIARTEDFIRRNIAGQNTKQAQGRRKALEKLERVERPGTKKKTMSLNLTSKGASGKDVLMIKGVAKGFDGRSLYKPFDGEIYRGERVGLIGANGTGKSTLIKILCGMIEPDQGKIVIGHNVNMGYYDQMQSSLDLKNTVMDEIWQLLPGEGQQTIRGVGGRFLFSDTDIEKKISSLSGGEKARLMLAKLMIAGPNFLVMDEPTNHLDIDSREVVEEALDEFEGTILVVSHDRYFLDREVDHIWEIEGDQVIKWEGNYTSWLEQKTALSKDDVAVVPKAKPRPEAIKPEKTDWRDKEDSELADAKEKQKRVAQLQKRQEELEKKLAELETKKKGLEDAYLDPELTRRPDKMRETSMAYEAVKDELDATFSKWQELEERKTGLI